MRPRSSSRAASGDLVGARGLARARALSRIAPHAARLYTPDTPRVLSRQMFSPPYCATLHVIVGPYRNTNIIQQNERIRPSSCNNNTLMGAGGGGGGEKWGRCLAARGRWGRPRWAPWEGGAAPHGRSERLGLEAAVEPAELEAEGAAGQARAIRCCACRRIGWV
jgi:hypothetical protein